MNTYKVVYRKLVDNQWGASEICFVLAESISKARAIVITKGIMIERIIRI